MPSVYDSHILAKRLMEKLPYIPNQEQVELIANLSQFCVEPISNGYPVFVLNGYAGTGKTSLVGALVSALSSLNQKSVLLAPTGRAAKVFSEYSKHSAFTVHKKIYRQKKYSPDGGAGFTLAPNKHTNTIFFVDEASMLPNTSTEGTVFGTGRLLDDLVEYVYSSSGCKLILIGDDAQLPPVGLSRSPALDIEFLKSMGLDIYPFSLTTTSRQAADSGILYNATHIRTTMQQEELPAASLIIDRFDDFRSLTGEYLIETLSDLYDSHGIENSIIITRSNKRAVMFNTGIRSRILYREDELVAGDKILIAKNNYLWSESNEALDFIANGDIATVERVYSTESCFGFRFARTELSFTESDVSIEAMVNLETLMSDSPTLSHERQQLLFNNVMETLSGSQRTRYELLKQHPYFNALQVKYAYALTCHKAQGGQWDNVFIDMGYIPEEAYTSRDLYRWLYTAITRAKKRIYILK
ncbi:MAG: AAA family ATPase [Muribaculaceae bacterium]|nr:AAA family ATPase [Muribaculaceae bacterium]